MNRTMMVRIVPGLLLTAVFTLPASAAGQAASDSVAAVDELFAGWQVETAPGCAVGVARGGRTVASRAYGMADLEHGIENTTSTIFEAGSVSKQFAAAAIMLLVIDGEISLDDDVRTYVPEIPEYEETITLRHLLNHTSGLRDWGSMAAISGWGRGDRTHDHSHVLDILSRQSELNYPPGDRYSYTNSGYNLLAIIVDRVSGQSFADFSRARIFEPLGLENTQWRDDYRRIVPGRASAYSPVDPPDASSTGPSAPPAAAPPAAAPPAAAPPAAAPPAAVPPAAAPPAAGPPAGYRINRPIEHVHGNGGLLTTVGDLLRWDEHRRTGALLGGERFVELMHERGRLNDGTEIVYASGVRVTEHRGVPAVDHTGSTSGYRAYLGHFPEQELSVALLCNVSEANPGELGGAVADIFLGDALAPDEPAPLPGDVQVTPEQIRSRAGVYREVETGASMRLEAEGDTLRIAQGPRLIPLSPVLFQVEDGARRLEFEGAPEGGRERVRMTTPPGDEVSLYEPVDAFEPDAEALAEYTGEYWSEDAEVVLSVEVREGELVIERRHGRTMSLTPAYADAFDGWGLVRFYRDDAGRVVELGLRQARVHDLRFQRMND